MFIYVVMTALVLTSCSGMKQPAGLGPAPGSGSSTFTVGGTVAGLTGTGLVLQDNGGDNLAISASGPFTFKTAIAQSGAYAVTVSTQPSNPVQPLRT
jgi:hypothetical protein